MGETLNQVNTIMRLKHIIETQQKDTLNEAVLELNEQVDYIWDNYFEKVHSDMINGRPNLESFILEKKQVFPSTDLPSSPEIDEANRLNPVYIIVHNLGDNAYFPDEQVITLNFNIGVVEYVMARTPTGEYPDALRRTEWNQETYHGLKTDVSVGRVKGTIHHELSHWIRDSLHNRHLQKMFRGAEKKADADTAKYKRRILQNQPSVALTSYELDAQIHSIIQLKREYAGIWDTLTFNKMTELNPSLNQIVNDGIRGGWYKKWKKQILKRMARENLLGRSMS